MIGTTITSPRRVAVAALMAAVAAAIAGPALAGVRPDDRAGLRSPGITAHVASARHATRPDDRAGIRGVVTQSRVLRVVHPVAAATDSFHRGDGLIGAGVAAGVAALLALAWAAVRRSPRIAETPPLPVERSL
jgi:hypothetical protein